MYIAMNRFKIILVREKEFENIWKNRDTHLANVSGFINFNLVKGESDEECTLYASHSTWTTPKDFINWTKSEEFKLLIRMLVNIKIFILVTLFLRVSMLLCES